MRVLVHVPARAGSKGVINKNLRTVGGLSLVARSVRLGQALLRRLGVEGEVLVDTDGASIAQEAGRAGASPAFLREAHLAQDTTPTVETVLGALARLQEQGRRFDVVVLLQPTSPLRSLDDVAACFDAHLAAGSALTVTYGAHPPQRALTLTTNGTLEPLFTPETFAAPRQAHGSTVMPNGAAYVTTVELLHQRRAFLVPGVTRAVVMPPERSIDIDTEQDLAIAEGLLAAEPVATMAIAGRPFGPGCPCLVIAEAGVNHNGDVKLAHKLVDAAADAGADVVKFQTFDPKKLVSTVAPMAEYQERNTGTREAQVTMLERLVLPREAHAPLMAHAKERGLIFLSTPFDEGSADFLEELGVPAFKIPSGELTNHPFIAHVARKGRPMLLSTGMANQLEVAAALDVVARHGNPPVALFHCVTNYPAAPSDTNLRAMDTMRVAFGRPTGMSDHSSGLTVMLAAVARGAQLVEKHYTLDRTMQGPDHAASLEPHELKAMVQGIRDIEASIGDGVKAPKAAEIPLIAVARKSLHAVHALPVGHLLSSADVIALRPGTGLSPARLEGLIGAPLTRAAAAGALLTEAHFT